MKKINKILGVSVLGSWRSSAIGALAATLYLISELETLTVQNIALAIAIGLGGLVLRDAKSSSENENLNDND